ncbi:hypothetical protein ACJZ2D_001028 [Fusarium nematophilum]
MAPATSFSHLPPEIRQYIWEETWPGPRVIERAVAKARKRGNPWRDRLQISCSLEECYPLRGFGDTEVIQVFRPRRRTSLISHSDVKNHVQKGYRGDVRFCSTFQLVNSAYEAIWEVVADGLGP